MRPVSVRDPCLQTSYYGTLGLYLVSLPGLYSTITRAVKFKPIQKVYEAPGPAAGREVRQTGEPPIALSSSMPCRFPATAT